MRVVLVDDGEALHESASRLWPEILVLPNTDVVSIPVAYGTAFVSPCPSRGDMTAHAVDVAYSGAMFPGIASRVRDAIRAVGAPDRAGGTFLCPGCAVVVDDLVVAPTMLVPGDVSATRNAYLAMSAALWAARDAGFGTLVVPGLCTGVGGMSTDDSVAQMKAAFDDIVGSSRHGVSIEQALAEQPPGDGVFGEKNA